MRTLNKIILIGRVGNFNLKSKTNAMGMTTRILDISLVTPKVTKNKETGEFIEKPIWHSVSIFGDTTIDYCLKSIEKGDELYVDGYLDCIEIVDPSGVKKKIYKVVVDMRGHISLFSKRRKPEFSNNDDSKSEGSEDGSDSDTSSDDSIPF